GHRRGRFSHKSRPSAEDVELNVLNANAFHPGYKSMRQFVDQNRGEEERSDGRSENQVMPGGEWGADFGGHPEFRHHPDVQHSDRRPAVVNNQRNAEDSPELKLL